eukprot:gene10236-21344_t
MLDRLVLLVFEKAIQEPSFANLYADMCSSLENKNCELAALAQTQPSFQPVNAKVQVHEVEVKSGILIKIFKNLENEEYFMSYMPYGDVDVSMVSQKAVPTQAAAEKDALTENSFRKRLIHLCQHEFYASVTIVRELYKKHLLKSGIMYEIFQEIVKRHPMKNEDIELLCKLLHTVGSTLEIKETIRMRINN